MNRTRNIKRGCISAVKTALSRRWKILSGIQRPGRYALRFFAIMLVLTLTARGTAGAAMPRVSLTSPSQSVIIQEASATAVITAEEWETIPLPAGITVEKVYAASGQSLHAGEAIVQLNLEELEKALETAEATRAQQQVKLNQLEVSVAPDASSVASAQQSLDRAQEDYARTDERTRQALDEANTALATAQTTYDDALRQLSELQARIDPAPTEEELTAAQQAVETAAETLNAAKQSLQEAGMSREDSLLSAKRSVENAQSALSQANSAYSEAQNNAALTAQSNAAQAEMLKIEQKENDEAIELLTSLVQSGGMVYAQRDAQLLQCTLEQGKPCPEQDGLRIDQAKSSLVAQISLPTEQAENISVGQTVTLTQGASQTDASVRTVKKETENEMSCVTAVLPDDADGFKNGSAQASIVFSRTSYASCVPASAIRQDTQGTYVLTVEETESTFGISRTAVRVPVTVLEVSSDGQIAAIENSVGDNVIVSSDRPVSSGTAVRVEE